AQRQRHQLPCPGTHPRAPRRAPAPGNRRDTLMDLTGTLAISGSALSAERLRLDTIASNLANASTTRTPEGGPYRRRNVVFAAEPLENDFGETLASLAEQGAHEGVTVTDVVEDRTPPRMVFDPSHPDANADGYVAYPDVDPMLAVEKAELSFRLMMQVRNKIVEAYQEVLRMQV